jgi:hypothetical protein
MTTREEFLVALTPVLELVATLDLRDAESARRTLESHLPADGPVVDDLRRRFVAGRTAGWLCDRDGAGVRYSRVQKSTAQTGPQSLSVDAVHMCGPGPGHTHENGEVDLCLVVDGSPCFDGAAPGWTVYPPGSWHVPTVTGGTMDILYFLPGGAIRFGPPSSTVNNV